ncbi:mechanosensitive ion channel family protein [Parasalinivibrio latis]|uniref:mechanosensitive ion channel family protein n=1 Tax=Parasalinivibrio latis TaxID=2952610 RepID=UPI0030DF3AFD
MLDHSIRAYVAEKLTAIGVNNDPYGVYSTLIFVTGALLVALLAYLLVHRVFIRLFKALLSRSKDNWVKGLARFRVLDKLALLIPVMVLELSVPPILARHPLLSMLTDRVLSVTVLILFIWMLFSLLDALNELASMKGITRRLPIKSFVQLIKLFTFFVGVVVSISVFADESPVYFLSGLGVATGLVLLVFKDTILGFVAGIQLSANRMVSLSDWIEMEEFGANGTVEEISLTTVKVRNFDNTVTMLPAYALVQNAFVNWQGMSDSGGRRIMRAFYIDVTSIRFMSEEEIEALKEVRILREYLFERTKEIREFNENLGDVLHVANTRNMTNIGTFRAYLNTYLRSHKDIHPYMLFMVRQLPPTSNGLPLQIYAFTNNTDWTYYEGVQADIFDHIYAIMPLFGLRPYQAFGGHDATRIGEKGMTQPGSPG